MTKSNLRIWSEVDKTNPGDTKKVEFGRRFTAIDAYAQIKHATELFGPLGIGWGFDYHTELIDDLYIVHLQLWYHDPTDGSALDGGRETVKAIGGVNLKDKKGTFDKDGPKKALTDALTKALSYLGFNADVFLGLFDDNKYVAQRAREEAKEKAKDKGGDTGSRPQGEPDSGCGKQSSPSSPPATSTVNFPPAVVELAKSFDRDLIAQATLTHDEELGVPDWFTYKVGFGQNKDHTWGHMAAGSEDGRRAGWLWWLIGQAEEDAPSNPVTKLNLLRAMAVLKWKQLVAEGSRKKPDGFGDF